MTKMTIALPDTLIRDLRQSSERSGQDIQEIIVKILTQSFNISKGH